jgi:hypothetical protein
MPSPNTEVPTFALSTQRTTTYIQFQNTKSRKISRRAVNWKKIANKKGSILFIEGFCGKTTVFRVMCLPCAIARTAEHYE